LIPSSVGELQECLEQAGYICEEETVLTVFLALHLQKPLLIEGAPGVGKTEMGKALSRGLGLDLIRLQCYEGLDENKALYEWNYQKQLISIQINRELQKEELRESDLFTDEYLMERPLLKSIRSGEKTVLLIDEVDKCDHEFEAFLFEVLSDFQVSIPEMGTVTAANIPVVVLTSNSERELSDALRRRCIYLYLDFPEPEREVKIIKHRFPDIGDKLAGSVAHLVEALRQDGRIQKKPSIAETLDWVSAMVELNRDRLSPSLVESTLNLVLKSRNDQQVFREEIGAQSVINQADRAAVRG